MKIYSKVVLGKYLRILKIISIPFCTGKLSQWKRKEVFKDDVDDLDDVVDVCNHHLNQFLHGYSKQIKNCADPFASHQVTVKTTLHEVTLDEYKELLIQNFDILPGQKLC